MNKNNLKINKLSTMSVVKQSIITAVCIALCIVLPMAFHSIPQAGMINRLINLSLFFYFPFLNVYFHRKKPLFLHLDCQSCAQSAFS